MIEIGYNKRRESSVRSSGRVADVDDEAEERRFVDEDIA
jgi:hypothetical protein